MSGGIPSYHNLEWRLDVEVSRRLDRDVPRSASKPISPVGRRGLQGAPVDGSRRRNAHLSSARRRRGRIRGDAAAGRGGGGGAKRAPAQISKPTFVLKLDTLPDGAASADEKKSLVFECDSAMMQHLGSQIAEALKAAEAPGAQRAVKYIK